MTSPGQDNRTPVENPPPEPPVRSQDEQVERTGRVPEVTGEPPEPPPEHGRKKTRSRGFFMGRHHQMTQRGHRAKPAHPAIRASARAWNDQ